MVAVGFSCVSPALILEEVGKSRPEFCKHQEPDFHFFFFFLVQHTGPLGCLGWSQGIATAPSWEEPYTKFAVCFCLAQPTRCLLLEDPKIGSRAALTRNEPDWTMCSFDNAPESS